MKRLMTAVCCTCLMSVTAAAQTGSMDKMDKDKMAKDKMSKDKMGMADAHAALHVKSVTMIAATCP